MSNTKPLEQPDARLSATSWIALLFSCLVDQDTTSFPSQLENWTEDTTPFDVNQVDKTYKCTLLHKACAMNRKEAVACLLSRPDIRISVKDQFQATPMHFAASNGSVDCVQLLLSFKDLTFADVGGRDSFGYTPIHLALKHGHYHVLKMLLDYDANLINQKRPNSKSCLHMAVEQLDLTAVKNMFNHEKARERALFMHRDENGRTFLQTLFTLPTTCQGNSQKKVKLLSYLLSLCEEESFPDKHVDRSGWNMFHMASINNQYELVQVLALFLDREVYLKMLITTDEKGRTPFHYAALHGSLETLNTFILMIENDPLPFHLLDINHQTPVQLAFSSLQRAEHSEENEEVKSLVGCLQILLPMTMEIGKPTSPRKSE